jgi:hypothetical protein
MQATTAPQPHTYSRGGRVIEVRESSDKRKGPFFLFDSATETVILQGIFDRQLAEEIARDVNSQKTFTPSKTPRRRRRYYDFPRLFHRE